MPQITTPPPPPVAPYCEHCNKYYQDCNCEVEQEPDPVNRPAHYTAHPSGVECIEITEAFTFNVGNAIKYLWRHGLKGDSTEDLRKAAWYVQRELERLNRG